MLIYSSLIHFGRFFLIFLRGKINKGNQMCFLYGWSSRFYPSEMYFASRLPSAAILQLITPNF